MLSLNLPQKLKRGGDPSSYHAFFNAFRKDRKEGVLPMQKYILVPLRHFGSVPHPKNPHSNYLILERLQQASISSDAQPHLASAMEELEHDVLAVAERNAIESKAIPQYWKDVLVLGNTNPKDPRKGRWVLALPHDIV